MNTFYWSNLSHFIVSLEICLLPFISKHVKMRTDIVLVMIGVLAMSFFYLMLKYVKGSLCIMSAY